MGQTGVMISEPSTMFCVFFFSSHNTKMSCRCSVWGDSLCVSLQALGCIYYIICECFLTFLQARILDSVVFKRDMEVGRQEGHQLQTELGLTREKQKSQTRKRMTAQEFTDGTDPRLKSSVIIYLYGAAYALRGHISQPSRCQSNLTGVI